MAMTDASRAQTLADVLAAVDAAGLAERRRQDMASAVRTVARLLGRAPEGIPADPRALGLRLKTVAPLAAGLSPGRWNNIRSLLRAALELIRPMTKGRSTTPLSPAWQALADRLPTRADRTQLSRLMHWMSAKDIQPDVVTAEVLEGFRAELHFDSLLRNPEGTWSGLTWSWNRSVGRVKGWPQLRIAKTRRKITYTMPWSAFPASLKADVDAWLERLAGHDFSDDGPARPARPSTLATREYQLRSFASALVHRGRDPLSLASLACLVAHDAFVDGLRFYYNRRGGRSSRTIHGLAGMLKSVARHWVRADEATLTKMAHSVKRLAVTEEGLTPKNRVRLRAFDDEEQVTRFLHLPQRLRKQVDRGRLPPRRAAVLGGIAVAIEILIVAPVRLQNLADLDVDRHFVRTGRKLHLVVPAAEVKNAADLEFELPARTVELIEWYQAQYRPLLASPGCTALFPGRSGGPKAKHTLALQVSECVFKYAGLRVNVHLFRHVGAKLYLDVMPGGYEVMRRVFGHKKMDTTVRFYTGLESKAAARHFDQVILQRLETDHPAGVRAAWRADAPVAKARSATKPVAAPPSRPQRRP